MSDALRDKAKLTAMHDQDLAKAWAWWREQSNEAKMQLWNTIQKDYKNPFMEAMSRLAQLQFEKFALEDCT